MSNLYWFAPDKNAVDFRKELSKASKKDLEEMLFNERYNDFCSHWADEGTEKRIPYMGWFWRSCNFASGKIPIGFDDSYVAVMENNKWGYPERLLTPEEFAIFMQHLDNAMQANRKGGILSEIHEEVNRHITLLHEWMQTLPPPN